MNDYSNHQKESAHIAVPQSTNAGASSERDANEGSQIKRHAIMSAFATVMAVTAVLYSLPIHAANQAPTALRAA